MLHHLMDSADKSTVTASALTTPLLANAEHDVHISKVQPLKGIGAADDIAKIAVVLGSDDCTWMTGAALPVDGGFLCQ
jgi:NAD(P)-dependent dehydrogenase (short-subunit alcohol dehydrogenase family)